MNALCITLPYKGTVLRVGKVMHSAFMAELQIMAKGKKSIDGRDITPIMPQHDEENPSCNPRSHLRLNDYSYLDETMAGIVITAITPPTMSGSSIGMKPSFWETVNDIYTRPVIDGSKTHHMIKAIIDAQPSSNMDICLQHNRHFYTPYVENCSFHDYVEHVIVGHAKFQEKHGVAKPNTHDSWKTFIWYTIMENILRHFRPELSGERLEYYKRFADIAKALRLAFQTDQTYDQSKLDAYSMEVKEHINPAKGYEIAIKLFQDIYSRCLQGGLWSPKPFPAAWRLPDYEQDRFAGVVQSKKARSHFSEERSHFGSVDRASKYLASRNVHFFTLCLRNRKLF